MAIDDERENRLRLPVPNAREAKLFDKRTYQQFQLWLGRGSLLGAPKPPNPIICRGRGFLNLLRENLLPPPLIALGRVGLQESPLVIANEPRLSKSDAHEHPP